ncbi:unnamed protein product, partial [Mesorhabditis spiculigera]
MPAVHYFDEVKPVVGLPNISPHQTHDALYKYPSIFARRHDVSGYVLKHWDLIPNQALETQIRLPTTTIVKRKHENDHVVRLIKAGTRTTETVQCVLVAWGHGIFCWELGGKKKVDFIRTLTFCGRETSHSRHSNVVDLCYNPLNQVLTLLLGADVWVVKELRRNHQTITVAYAHSTA